MLPVKAAFAITCSLFSECFRTADWQYRSLFCMLTGMMSGIRRSRRSLHCHKDYGFQES